MIYFWGQSLLEDTPTPMPPLRVCSRHTSLENAPGIPGEGENAMATSVRHCAEDFAYIFSL